MTDPDQITENEIIHYLTSSQKNASHQEEPQIPEDSKPAAVLIPLLKRQIGSGLPSWHILLTRRTEKVADHKGQVSFPGGRSDNGDPSPEATALRETHEEIGLNPRFVRLAGRLNPLLTITNYLVTPVVGFIPWPYNFQLQNEEVSRIFIIPLSWLADPANFELRDRKLTTNYGYHKILKVVFFRPYDGETLWGVSAEITLRLLKTLKIIPQGYLER